MNTWQDLTNGIFEVSFVMFIFFDFKTIDFILGVLMYRGFKLQQFTDQCFGNNGA